MIEGNLDVIATALGLRKSGSEFKGPCPICGGRDRFHIKTGHSQQLLVHCRHGCDWRDLAARLKSFGLARDSDPVPVTFSEASTEDCLEFIGMLANSIHLCRPVHSRWRAEARRCFYRLTGLSGQQLIDAFLWVEVFDSAIADPKINIRAEDFDRRATFGDYLDEWGWLLETCVWMTFTK